MLRRTIALISVSLAVTVGAAQAQDDHAYTADQIQNGYRLYTGQCQLCHGVNGDSVSGSNLAQQQLRLVKTDEDIRNILSTGTNKGMPPFPTFKPDEVNALIAFIRSGMDRNGLPFRLGDAVRGRTIYESNGCAGCHRIAGSGGLAGPDLTDIGFTRRPGQMFTSLTDPIKATMPINRPVIIQLKNGETVKGRRYDEDTFFVRMIDGEGNLRSISKSEIRNYQIRQDTDMPSFRDRLTDTQLGDLVAYLVSMKG